MTRNGRYEDWMDSVGENDEDDGVDELRRELEARGEGDLMHSVDEDWEGQLRHSIDLQGMAVLGGAVGEYPFMYTIGNSLVGAPEVLVVGVIGDTAGEMVFELASRYRRGELDLDAQRVNFGARADAGLVRGGHRARKLVGHRRSEKILGDAPFEVVQLVIPDEAGRMPWEEGCEEPYRSTPILRDQG